MFAFALLDNQSATLYLVRDSTGIKPLYYSVKKNQHLVFASEVKAFKCIPGFEQETPNWQIYMMAFGHLPEPITTLSSVISLPKGKYLKYSLIISVSFKFL